MSDVDVIGQARKLIDHVRVISGAEPTRIIMRATAYTRLLQQSGDFAFAGAVSFRLVQPITRLYGVPVYVIDQMDADIAVDSTPRERWAETEWGDMT